MTTHVALTAADIRWDTTSGPIEAERDALTRDARTLLDAADAPLIPDIDDPAVARLVALLAEALIEWLIRERIGREALHAATAVGQYEHFGRELVKPRRYALLDERRAQGLR